MNDGFYKTEKIIAIVLHTSTNYDNSETNMLERKKKTLNNVLKNKIIVYIQSACGDGNCSRVGNCQYTVVGYDSFSTRYKFSNFHHSFHLVLLKITVQNNNYGTCISRCIIATVYICRSRLF